MLPKEIPYCPLAGLDPAIHVFEADTDAEDVGPRVNPGGSGE
jgi:hypothetical protein